MPRPFIEFIQTQWLDWKEVGDSLLPGRFEKVLSADPDTGAVTRLLWYPPAWQVDHPVHATAAEEFIVLGGSMLLNGVRYQHLGYGFLPAGHTRRDWSTPGGGILLSFSHAAPTVDRGAGASGDPSLQSHVDPYTAPWRDIDYRPKMAPGARKLVLRTDPGTEEATWLLGAAPVRSGRFPERHPVTEETFVIDGWSIGPRGRMGPGAYFCRPPDEWHGPYGTPASGKLNIVRCLGGPLSTDYNEAAAIDEFDWNPRYDPVLPPELLAVAKPHTGTW